MAPSEDAPPRPAALVRAQLAEALRSGAAGGHAARLMSDGVDRIVVEAFSRAMAACPLPGASLLALGGYGRRELAPYSDTDLMLLVPEQGEAADRLAQAVFTPLWDAGLEPGSSLRTSAQALEAAQQDHTVATALLDARHLAGDAEASRSLLRDDWAWLQGERREAFIAAKVDELVQRRRRFEGSVYLLEPNVKTGVGALRDLAAGLWIARARHHLDGLAGVAHYGLLPRRELETVTRARDTMLRIRAHLHLASRRRDDRLTFAAQEKLAPAMGYEDGAHGLGVEALMRDYYLAAQAIEHATDALVDRCALEPVRRGRREVLPVDDHFELFDGRLVPRDAEALSRDPALLVQLFTAAESAHAPVASSARDLVATEVERLGPALATSPAAMDALLSYLESPGANGDALRGLYETGVLGGLFPELARLKARVQHDVYHVFTVDAHTLFAVQKLLRLRSGAMAAEQPVFTRLAQDLARPLPLLVGMLFHDLGKGLGGDHSRRGEELVRRFGERIGLWDAECIEDAAFLVREHLRLSQVAFRRDLSDPAMVDGVAQLVGRRERLDMLYLLTYADISSVGPETWTEWRARLLGELYEKARARFEADAASVRASSRGEAAAAGARALRKLVADAELEAFLAALPERYLATVPAEAARRHFDAWRRARGRAVTGTVLARSDLADASELVLVLDDRPGLLAMVAGALAAHSIDILGAEIYSLADGRVLDTFLVREPGGLPASPDRVARALADLERLLAGSETAPQLIARRRGARRTFAPGPSLPARVRFDPAAARDATVVDVYAHDRVGLLHDIASAFHRAGASIVLARIATEGNRATDGFYLQDTSGAKITDPARLEAIERALAEALAEG
jgi:[protein-PII] uridylyltransferase